MVCDPVVLKFVTEKTCQLAKKYSLFSNISSLDMFIYNFNVFVSEKLKKLAFGAASVAVKCKYLFTDLILFCF